MVLLAGCKGKAADAGADSRLGGEITFWLMPNAPDETHNPWLSAKAAAFERETGVKVNFEVVGWGDAWTKISTAIATGEGVDVFQVGTTWNPQFAATGGLAKIDMNQFGGSSSFMAANLASTSYKNEYYGVPWFAETRALYYNKTMFAEAGVTPPTSYAELYEVSARIIDKFGSGSAIAIAGTSAWDLLHNWAIILWANGGKLTDAGRAAFNGPAGVEALSWYLGLLERGYAANACAEYNQPQADSAFINGNVAMCFMGPWNVANIDQENPTLQYGVVEPPAGSAGKASFSGGSNLVVLEGSRNKAAALAWIEYLVSDSSMIEYTKTLTHMMPATLSAYNDSYYQSGIWKIFKDTLSYATAYLPLGVWGDIENAIVNEFKASITDAIGGRSDQAAVRAHLDAAADMVNAALAKEK
ncbi:MAG: ABC transporter substrate-binding protein [Spirochaetes bacterium GWD1_61_31]|nr:MAG: ABC transporter substrate-binding protein [Spirochaetes bacterium GWB1_60_80]OHD32956.1 MAG: ABC transporter substrate-binding protein [Spirochaetes bacterium GWC1_61_12]OHD38693.1 MAG: ABC transporter substrate-binding protein [Spirochaetes bacterium GWD1_61_31]OHD43261.1 MAG: ABC transporter substrate-binding protein [Spirochaetes bacterium GWE1_60_18]OHD58821.1 MAG: ABC transporter substrate-binding protein [Spirochaetes bacterium GWF1_60_12]HAP42685.1 ABC transporter substrate-bind